MLIAVWIAGTYTFERFRYCGYLALRSATPRCGKSLLLRILSQSPMGSVYHIDADPRRVISLDAPGTVT